MAGNTSSSSASPRCSCWSLANFINAGTCTSDLDHGGAVLELDAGGAWDQIDTSSIFELNTSCLNVDMVTLITVPWRPWLSTVMAWSLVSWIWELFTLPRLAQSDMFPTLTLPGGSVEPIVAGSNVSLGYFELEALLTGFGGLRV